MSNLATTLSFPQAVLRDDPVAAVQVQARERLFVVQRELLWGILAAAVFGVALGSYGHSIAQVVTSAIKLPILLFGSAALCFPTFHVLQVLRAPRVLSLGESLAIQSRALCATAMIWAAFALPLFFVVGTAGQYRLAQFLALGVGAVGGLVGLERVRSSYQRLCEPERKRWISGPLVVYFAIHAVVGAQLAWVLRPFIGSPTQGFELFRDLEGTIFGHILVMFGG
jgi:hypothetical protein